MVTGEAALVLDTVRELGEGKGDRFWKALEGFQTIIHGVEGGSDGEDGDDHAHHDGDLLLPGCGSDEVAGLEVLGGVSGVGGCDADDAPDGNGKCSERGGGPAFHEEDGGGGHEGSNGHSGD